jgi:cadmium resistance protein CadD (predicted permease)
MLLWALASAKLTDVAGFFSLFVLAVVLFVSTNVDDLLVLAGFFADPRGKVRDIVAGQYAGMTVLFGVSALGAALALAIPNTYLGLLGLFPIAIGIKKIFPEKREADAVPLGRAGSIAGMALVTIANGGDNLGIYMPAFAVRSRGELLFLAIAFAGMTGLWCWFAYWMVNHPSLGAPFRRYARLLVPLILIGLGISILSSAGTIAWLLHGSGKRL